MIESHGTIMRILANDIGGIENAIADLKKDLRVFGDIKRVKVWLKHMQYQRSMAESDDLPF